MESEFVACTPAVQEAMWLRRFFEDLGVVSHVSDHVTLFCDSTTTLDYTKDPKCHSRTNHIDLKMNFIRENIANNEVILEYMLIGLMVADPLTKSILKDAFCRHVSSLRLRRV